MRKKKRWITFKGKTDARWLQFQSALAAAPLIKFLKFKQLKSFLVITKGHRICLGRKLYQKKQPIFVFTRIKW